MAFLIFACVVSGFIVSFLATALMRLLAPRVGLIDHPNARKVHVTPTPLGGGIGVWVGIVLPLVGAQVVVGLMRSGILPAEWLPAVLVPHLSGAVARGGQLWLILGCGTVISLMGLVDDRWTLSWRPKLVIQFLVAAALVAGGVRATVFVDAPWVGWLLTLLWIVTLTNAFNFLDNMDALSSGIGLISAGMFATIMLVGTGQPHWFVAAVLLVIAGSLAGFLCHNWPPARIFMGDTGSCLIGMLIASLTLVGTFYDYQASTARHVILAPLCVLAVPLYDFLSVVALRIWQGRSPFQPDKQHFSHRLVDLGMSRLQAVLTIHLLTATTGLAGLVLYHVRGWTGASLVLAIVVCVLIVIGLLEAAARKSRLAVAQIP